MDNMGKIIVLSILIGAFIVSYFLAKYTFGEDDEPFFF